MAKNKKKRPSSVPQEGGYVKYLAGIMKEVGLPGFIVLVSFSIFLTWGTVNQKKDFIDRFFLLKHVDQNPIPCVLVVIFLTMLLVIGSIYSNKILNLRKEENNRIGREKSELQELILKKKLKSSD